MASSGSSGSRAESSSPAAKLWSRVGERSIKARFCNLIKLTVVGARDAKVPCFRCFF